MKKEMFEIRKLKVNPNNPRLIKDEKFKRLCRSIKDFPEMMALRPIIYDENNVILGGNMRYWALQHLGMKEVPADWVKSANELNEEQKKEFVIKDNNSFGEYDFDFLANEWSDLPLQDWGVDLPISFLLDEPENLTASATTVKPQIVISFVDNDQLMQAKDEISSLVDSYDKAFLTIKMNDV
jgi:hypothetical protein